MKTRNNPFVVTGKIQLEYFCDRQEESQKIIKAINNHNNMVLISPRRMGKTGLIQYCYEDSSIKKNYYTFFIDILQTANLEEFVYTLGKEIFNRLLKKNKKLSQLFVQIVKSIQGKFGYDPISGSPTFNVLLGDITEPKYTLQEIFQFIEKADKPCIISIDEFQQISQYPENNVEAFLRTHIQQLENVHFIFAGSERHMMQQMFLSKTEPFYQSADMMELNAIKAENYIPFILKHFQQEGRTISQDNILKIYNLFKGHTYYIQKTFNAAFAETPPQTECTLENLKQTINAIIEERSFMFRQILSNIPNAQRGVLYAIANEGEAKHISSSEFTLKHKLKSTSSTQSAIKKLIKQEIISKENAIYSISDRFFALWIQTIYGKGISLDS